MFIDHHQSISNKCIGAIAFLVTNDILDQLITEFLGKDDPQVFLNIKLHLGRSLLWFKNIIFSSGFE